MARRFFPRVNALQAADALDGPLLQGVAADGVARVRRVDDESSVAEQVGDAEEVGRIVVLFAKVLVAYFFMIGSFFSRRRSAMAH